jgi:hypothetical protein
VCPENLILSPSKDDPAVALAFDKLRVRAWFAKFRLYLQASFA